MLWKSGSELDGAPLVTLWRMPTKISVDLRMEGVLPKDVLCRALWLLRLLYNNASCFFWQQKEQKVLGGGTPSTCDVWYFHLWGYYYRVTIYLILQWHNSFFDSENQYTIFQGFSLTMTCGPRIRLLKINPGLPHLCCGASSVVPAIV